MSTNGNALPSATDIRQELLTLNNKRTRLEGELKSYLELLESQNVGMDDPLVDAEGFPRNDIDVYSVRTARNKINVVRNDLRQLMQQIEHLLHQYHQVNTDRAGGNLH